MHNRRRLFGIVLPALTIIVFAIFLTFSFMRLSAIDRNMRIEMTQNMLWVISRAQVTSLQYKETATLRSLGLSEQADVDRAFNIFLGEFIVLNHGPQRRHMGRLRSSAALDRIEQARPRLAALSADIAVGDARSVAEIHRILGPYDAALARAANMSMVAEWDGLGSKLDNFRREIATILFSLLIISLAGAGMTLYLARATRSAHLRARQLERERAFSQLLVRSSSESIIAVDLQRRCTMWNQAAATLFNVSAEVAMRRALGATSAFFRLGPIESALGTALQGQPITLTDQMFFRGRGLDTPPTYLDLRCFPLRDGAEIIGSILLLSDVTDQHRARRALSERRDYLEAEVRQRTEELNAALVRERAATDIYRNFAAMVSHQFRTPLAIVDSALQRLIRRADRMDSADLVARSSQARGAIARLVRLVESTLDAARMDAGQIEKRTEARDLGQLAHEALRRQQDETPDRLFIVEQSASSLAQCDPIHTEHIIVNLLSNAAKYAPPATMVRMQVGVIDGRACCTVLNEGCIDPDDHDHLFDRYFRGANGQEHSGVGIGLYMAQSLARLQGGDVTFRQTGADRLAFTLSLPLASGQGAPMAIAGACAS
jgi:K+-sensing histidine kinase KdpD